jgi:hypothetical protein
MEYLHTNADGTTVKYTDEMIKNVIKDVQYYKDQRQGYLDRYHKARVAVYDFFNERYDSGSDEITCTVDDVNELLETIGADKLRRMYTVTGRIEFTVTDIEADSEDDARDQVENNLTVEFDGNTVDDYSIDVNDVDQQ